MPHELLRLVAEYQAVFDKVYRLKIGLCSPKNGTLAAHEVKIFLVYLINEKENFVDVEFEQSHV